MPQQVLQEVDNNFIGVNSRLDPSNLQPGFAQSAYNVRLQRGTAQPRKGCARLLPATNADTMVGSGTYVDANGQDNIVLVYTNGIQLYNTETNILGPKSYFPSQLIGGTTYYRDIDQGDPVDVVQALNKLYIFRGKETNTRYGTGGTSTTAALDINHAAIAPGASGTVTATWINTPSIPVYTIGDEITVFNITDAQHPSFNNTYLVTSVSGSSFTFVYTNNTGLNINAAQHVYACVVKVKPPLIWNGSSFSVATQSSIIGNIQTQTGYTEAYGSVPPADFGFYFQNRLVCNVSSDQLVVSDIFSDLFDFQINNFIINQGGNDTIVGVLPWIENQFLVFMKKSIYIAYVETTSYGSTGDASPGANSSITVVTTQVGCLSRKSIVAAGQYVFFMSGKGVHVLTPQLDLKLIGQTMPLSEPIDDFFDSVNFDHADKVVASYYDNRFFIALPTGSASRPNAILVYNTLNQQWECIDTYPNGMYIDDYAVCQYGNKRRQFILTRFDLSAESGGIFLTEEYPNNTITSFGDQFTGISGSPVLPFFLPATLSQSSPRLTRIDARIRSREYTFDSTNEKRFSRGEYQFNNSSGDSISIVARSHDPDVSETVMNYVFSGSSTTDATLRPRIALRGAVIDMEVIFNTGRPALKSAALYAIVSNRNMVSQE